MYPIRLYIGMTKSKSPELSIIVPSILVMHLVNGPQFLNDT